MSIAPVPSSITRRLGVALLAVLPVLVGCTPWATYPSIDGTLTIDNPNVAPVPELLGRAVESAYRLDHPELDYDDELPVVPYNLPEGTPLAVWRNVDERLGFGRPATADDTATAVYHVKQVRVRGTEAQVDVVRFSLGGTPILTELFFDRGLTRGWSLERHRDWRIGTDVPDLAWTDALQAERDAREARIMAGEERMIEDSRGGFQDTPSGR